MTRTTLRGRLNRILFHWLLLFVLASAVVLLFSSAGLRHDVEEERELLARTIAGSLDEMMSRALRDAAALERDLPDLGPDGWRRMRAFRFESPFHQATYILDGNGAVVVSDPTGVEPLPRAALGDRPGITPGIVRDAQSPATVALVLPFRRDGAAYHLVSEMNLQDSPVGAFLEKVSPKPALRIAVIDRSGRVVGASDPTLLGRSVAEDPAFAEAIDRQRPLLSETVRCRLCPDAGRPPVVLTALVPLRFAPWGVLIQERKESAFAAITRTRQGMMVAGALLAATAVLLSRALVRSVVVPVGRLSGEAERIRRGDLSTPIAVSGDREVEVLARTLEEGRVRLAATLDELQRLNDSLESQVAERTEQIRGKYRDLEFLYAVAQLARQESEPAGIVRGALGHFLKHSRLQAAAVVIRPPYGPPETIAEPPGTGAEPPDAWNRREILRRGELEADLFFPGRDGLDEEIVTALVNQLAVMLMDAYLRQRNVLQEEQRRVLLRRILGATEEERRRLARELHDETAQLLTAIQLSLEKLPADDAQVAKVKGLVKTAQSEIHRVIRDLRPSALDDLGLAAAMRTYARENLEKHGVQVNLEIEEGLPARPEIETVTFRIYQELVTNILRHSRAENVSVELYEDRGRLVLAVEDDGTGFDPVRQRGVGITGMQERASLVNGVLRFDSERGMGTHVVVEIPTS